MTDGGSCRPKTVSHLGGPGGPSQGQSSRSQSQLSRSTTSPAGRFRATGRAQHGLPLALDSTIGPRDIAVKAVGFPILPASEPSCPGLFSGEARQAAMPATRVYRGIAALGWPGAGAAALRGYWARRGGPVTDALNCRLGRIKRSGHCKQGLIDSALFCIDMKLG